MNRNYGKLNLGGIEYGPDTLTINGRKVYNPQAVHYRIAGYMPVVDVMPSYDTAPEGKHWEPRGWKIEPESATADMIVREYVAVDDPPAPPRRWTRLALKTALAQAGLLSQALAYLAQVEVADGYSAAAALQDCDYIEEGFGGAERWNALLDGAAGALGKTRALIDAFLDTVPTEGGV